MLKCAFTMDTPSPKMNQKEQEYTKAKTYLLQESTESGYNMYDHLNNCLSKLLDERPENIHDGRYVWWNPVQENEDDFEDEDEDGEREEPDEPGTEIEPPPLIPLFENNEIENMLPWTTKLTSNLIPQYTITCIQSNIWSGAYVFAIGKKFENFYIGWGHKFSQHYSPPSVPNLMEEFPSRPKITEVENPTAKEETSLRLAQQEAAEAAEEMEEGEEEEGEDD